MIIKTGTFTGVTNDIAQSNSKIVIFGMGVIGSTVTVQLLCEYNLDKRILFCVDNDRTLWKSTVNIGGRDIEILSPDMLKGFTDNITIFVTLSRYGKVIEQLNSIAGTSNYSCYIIPILCLRNFHNTGGKGVLKTSDRMVIPKKIHYMWLGGKKIPSNIQKCIDSWRKFCPDYELVKWDESNYDVHKNIFVAQAYDNRLFGFVPDFARLDILYEYGGIYLDTDVELRRNLDELLYQEAFCSVEKWQVLNFGGCSGAIKGHSALVPFLRLWEKHNIIRYDGTVNNISSGFIDTTLAFSAGYKVNGQNQSIMGMNVYTYDYFHPYDYMSGKIDETDDTFSVHHFNGGWLSNETKSDHLVTMSKYDLFIRKLIDVG